MTWLKIIVERNLVKLVMRYGHSLELLLQSNLDFETLAENPVIDAQVVLQVTLKL